MAEGAGEPVGATNADLSQIRQDIQRTRLRVSDTLAAIDARLGALTHDRSPGAMNAARAREGGVVGLVAAAAIGAGRMRTGAQRLGASPRTAAMISSVVAALAGVAVVAGMRRRRRALRRAAERDRAALLHPPAAEQRAM